MLDVNLIRKDPEKIKAALGRRGFQFDAQKFSELDRSHRELLAATERLRHDRNKISTEVSRLGKEETLLAEAKRLSKELDEIEQQLAAAEVTLHNFLWTLPNIPDEDVPSGKDESENQVLREVGDKPRFDFTPTDYLELAVRHDLIDMERAGKVSGSRFGYLKREAALLEFALIQFTFQTLTDETTLKKIASNIKPGYPTKPFVPVVPPVMIKPDVFRKMARLTEADKDERYYLPADDLYLVGSAEHTLGPLHMDEVLAEHDLPLRYVGFSTSFRREAGSYGKDTRGILRVHQFDKIELESFTTPENSRTEQDFIVAIQEHLMATLKIPYRVVAICTGDMGGPDARQIDLEAWLPGQGKHRETHTSDLVTDYQARRLNTRVKRASGTTDFVHMNDATAFAIGRTLIAIIENYQKRDGTITVPKALQPYLGFSAIPRGRATKKRSPARGPRGA